MLHVDDIKSIKLEEGEYITSYDVRVLLTSLPVDPVISIIKQKLQQNTQLETGPPFLYNTSPHCWNSARKYLFPLPG